MPDTLTRMRHKLTTAAGVRTEGGLAKTPV
jgi:hypothetical protein